MKEPYPSKPLKIRKPASRVVNTPRATSTSTPRVVVNKSSAPSIARQRGSVTAKRTARQGQKMGNPDFSQSIISKEKAEQIYRKPRISMTQRLFFDASIALVAVTFMVLSLVQR